jgi:hypothetical protein
VVKLNNFQKFVREMREYNTSKLRDSKHIHHQCNMLDIQKFIIQDDGVVNVFEDVDISGKLLYNQIPIIFGKVDGDFLCDFNNLDSLKNAPHTVKGVFSCSNNALKSLEYIPTYIGGDLYIQNNMIASYKDLFNVNLQGNLIISLGSDEIIDADLQLFVKMLKLRNR